MISPQEAHEIVAAKTREHVDPLNPEATGIVKVLADVGADVLEVIEGNEWLLENGLPLMPLPSMLLGAFAAGAQWRALRGEIVVTDAMVDRALAKGLGGDLEGLGEDFIREFLRPSTKGVLEDILGLGPVADPPTDDGVGGS